MNVMQAFFEREGTVCTLANHAVSKKSPTEKERPMRAKMVVPVSQATFRNAVAGISGFNEDAVTELVTQEA